MGANFADIPLKEPFSNIALCLSGGGFRAAAYSLGVLSYLNRLKITATGTPQKSLLENVTFIASTSGGTITNLVFSSYLYQLRNDERAFYACYKKLYFEMTGELLLETAVDNLADEKSWDKSLTGKQRNIINSFALAYDTKLFGGETFDIFWKGKLNRDFSVCFNSTEFTRGISFRFQNESDTGIFELSGNRYIRFKENEKAVFGKIKLADILAASSCFPSGFEPIVFPSDFTYTDTTKNITLKSGDLQQVLLLEDYEGNTAPIIEPVALMDGGVTDNQALYSAMNADKRRRNKKKKEFDLIVVNDVTSYFMDPYAAKPETNADWGKKNIGTIFSTILKVKNSYKTICLAFIFLFIATLVTAIISNNEIVSAIGYFFAGAASLGLVLILFINWLKKTNPVVKAISDYTDEETIRNFILKKAGHEISHGIINKLLLYCKTASFGNLHHMIMARVNSVITMSVEVNLKQVRRLIYTLFYENSIWDNRRLSNFIYELSDRNKNSRTKRLTKKVKDQPSFYLNDNDRKLLAEVPIPVMELADDARNMGTTLWFGSGDTAKNKLQKIIQCGQITTCVNLLEYTLTLIRMVENNAIHLPAESIAILEQVKTELIKDWEGFKANPDFLFTEELKKIK